MTNALLVLNAKTGEGILVNSEGSAYARYSAYLPFAGHMLDYYVNLIADYCVTEGTLNTSDGAWAVSFDELYEHHDEVEISEGNGIDELVLKELQNAQLYYNLGNYLGNNYQSAIIVAQNAIKDYPYSKYKEPLELLVLKSKYQEAAQSIEEKKADRFREVVDEYYSFINDYPESENRKEADNIFKIAQRYVKE